MLALTPAVMMQGACWRSASYPRAKWRRTLGKSGYDMDRMTIMATFMKVAAVFSTAAQTPGKDSNFRRLAGGALQRKCGQVLISGDDGSRTDVPANK